MNKRKNQLSLVHIDEAREMLGLTRKLVQKIPGLVYAGGYSNAAKALKAITQQPPDILLLDIKMPGINGLELAQQVQQLPIHIVFLTAYSQYALEAFEVRAMHYLMKPLRPENLLEIVKRCREWPVKAVETADKSDDSKQALPASSSYPRRLFVPTVGNTRVLKLDELETIEAQSNYSVFRMANGAIHTSSRNLKVYLDALKNHPDFVRTHRSHIVNKNFISNIVRSRDKRNYVVLTNGRKLEIATHKKETVLKQILE